MAHWSTPQDLEYASFLAEHEEEGENLDVLLTLFIALGLSLKGSTVDPDTGKPL